MSPKFAGGSGNFEAMLDAEERRKNMPTLSKIFEIEEDSLKPVFHAFVDLNHNVGKLDKRIGDIVRRQSDDFYSAYKFEMELI
mmetsp:Transcript_31507/g.28700  ORF Transcript_31507/g.28700 Transcript_31507/m.28700 type:complete len:83 (+) Transcript_31507:116-364(+)